MVAVCAGNVTVELSAVLTVATTCTVVVPTATPVTTALPGVVALGTIVAIEFSLEVQAKLVFEVTSTPLLSMARALIVMVRPTPTSPEARLILTEYVSGVVVPAFGVVGALEPPPPPPPHAAIRNVVAAHASQDVQALTFMIFPPLVAFFPRYQPRHNDDSATPARRLSVGAQNMRFLIPPSRLHLLKGDTCGRSAGVSDSVHIRLVQECSWVAQMSSVLQPTAFSGSHQYAICKGMARQQPDGIWEMPYLPIDAFVSALDMPVSVMDYHEHVMTAGADARAACYVEVRVGESPTGFGAGIDANLVTASLKAVVSGFNRHLQAGLQDCPSERNQAIAA